MRLTEQQVRFFATFGYLRFPGRFAAEAPAISAAFEQVWAAHGGGHDGRAHDDQDRSSLVAFVEEHEYLSALIDDPRIDGPVSTLLGDDYNYAGSWGNLFVGDTWWHSDVGPEMRRLTIKIAFYLDPVDADTGCLRVIPGSHHGTDGYGRAVEKGAPDYYENVTDEAWGIAAMDVPAVTLESESGDMVLFNRTIKHASFGGGTRRRMFTLNFEERFRKEDLDELRDEIGSLSRFWAERAYGDVMIRKAGPQRMLHLQQRLANDSHLPALTARARAEMDEPDRA